MTMQGKVYRLRARRRSRKESVTVRVVTPKAPRKRNRRK